MTAADVVHAESRINNYQTLNLTLTLTLSPNPNVVTLLLNSQIVTHVELTS